MNPSAGYHYHEMGHGADVQEMPPNTAKPGTMPYLDDPTKMKAQSPTYELDAR